MTLESGLRDLLPWLESSRQAEAGRRIEEAQRELIERGLTT